MTSTQSNLINGIHVRVGYMFPGNELFMKINELIPINELNVVYLLPDNIVVFGLYFRHDREFINLSCAETIIFQEN